MEAMTEELDSRTSRMRSANWIADAASCNRLADSLLRDIAGFRDRTAAATIRTSSPRATGAKDWLKRTLGLPAVRTLPHGSSVVAGKERWGACVIAYLGMSAPGILSFAYWIITSSGSEACGGASLDLTDPDEPEWSSWIQ